MRSWLTGAVGVFVLSGALSTAQVPTFRSRVDSVRVDVLVMEERRIVRDLRASDFEITDNGVAQQVELASFEELPLNVILSFDMSQSMSGERLDHLRIAAHAVLDGLGRDDRAALLTFNDVLRRPAALTRDLPRVMSELDAFEPQGLTALIDGTFGGLTLAGSDTGRDLLLIFSDGVDTASVLSPARVLDAARRTDVTVYGVSVRGTESSFLGDLSRDTGGRAIAIESTTDLQKTFVSILDEFRQRYVLSFTPRGVSNTGWHRLQVRVKGRRPAITARQGYTAGP
jgi:VWFA-related protein